MWALIHRSARINREQSLGAAIAVTAAIGMLAAAAAWMIAGLTDPRLETSGGMLVTLSSSFIGIAAIIACITVASTIATGLRERRSQFALLAAVGASAQRLRTMILLETLLLFILAAPLGALLGAGLARGTVPLLQDAGLVPAGYGLPFSVLAPVCATSVMLIVALLASRSASRHAVQAPAVPALRSAVLESADLSPGRRLTALSLLVLGLLTAASPLVLPGMMGVALATFATLLLIAAIAVSGPAIASTAARLLLRRAPHALALALALMNVRGFSRRLTAVLVPFALVAALGAVQLSTTSIVDTASREQLSAGVSADLMGGAASAQQVESLRSLPGVQQVEVLGTLGGEILVDQEDDLPFTLWEPATFGTLAASGAAGALVDPEVVAGSLDDFGGPDAIAVSTDALLGAGVGLGDRFTLRIDGEREDRTIVAVYASSLGFGDYLIPRAVDASAAGTVLVATEASSSDAVRDEARGLGIELDTPSAFTDRAPASGETATSQVLLFALLAFALLASVNTLVALIRGRRDEFTLLSRLGATRGTVMRTVLIETMLAAGLAVLLGMASALPSAIGAAVARLGGWPPLPIAALAAIPLLLLCCAGGAAIAASSATARPRTTAGAP